jgi:hypothetical protein
MVIAASTEIRRGLIYLFQHLQGFGHSTGSWICNFNPSLRKQTNNNKIHGETEQAPPCDFQNRGGFENT